jgi:hypothetical protein
MPIKHSRIPSLSEKDIRRFFAKVNKTESCWLWTAGNLGPFGYGGFSVKGHAKLAHRVSWVIHRGSISEGMCVLHNCPGGDNPRCVNPDHLWLGTNRENSDDMVAKGRSTTGERNGAYTRPERRVRGDRHGRRLHPEKFENVRGEKFWSAKLTEQTVRDARKKYSTGEWTCEQLSKLFGVNLTTIHRAVMHLSWKHVV